MSITYDLGLRDDREPEEEKRVSWDLLSFNVKGDFIQKIRSPHGEATKYSATIIANTEPPWDIVCRLNFGYGKKEDETNARILAAARDLLKALELLVGRSDHSYFCDRNFRDGSCECGYYKSVGSAQRAINKARGK